LPLLEAIISGILQGLTEFLPISSSGHLVILHHLFGYKEPQLIFDIALHVGTLFSIIIYFRYDIIKMLKEETDLLKYILIATIPTGIIAFSFKGIFESFFSNIKIVGAMLLVTAVFLFVGDLASRKETKDSNRITAMSWLKALIIGIIQGISIIPGISRGGSTISTALLLKVGKRQAVKFSFLLSIPAVVGALLIEFPIAVRDAILTPNMIFASIIAFFVGLVSIQVLVTSILHDKLRYFAAYCILVGGITVIV
jgi:undecaprenyl-diphosphatase